MTGNYRGITLISNVYKIYSKVVEEAIMTYLEDDAILCEVQRGFQKDRRTEDDIFILQGLCFIRKFKNRKTYLAFLDLSKALGVMASCIYYGKVEYKGSVGSCLDHFIVMSPTKFRGDFKVEFFYQDSGLKQGCVLSPTLFSFLINDLVDMLKTEIWELNWLLGSLTVYFLQMIWSFWGNQKPMCRHF